MFRRQPRQFHLARAIQVRRKSSVSVAFRQSQRWNTNTHAHANTVKFHSSRLYVSALCGTHDSNVHSAGTARRSPFSKNHTVCSGSVVRLLSVSTWGSTEPERQEQALTGAPLVDGSYTTTTTTTTTTTNPEDGHDLNNDTVWSSSPRSGTSGSGSGVPQTNRITESIMTTASDDTSPADHDDDDDDDDDDGRSSSSSIMVTPFEMQRAVNDILECLHELDEPQVADTAATTNDRRVPTRPRLTWKQQWQQQLTRCRSEQEQTRALNVTFDRNNRNNDNNGAVIHMALALLRTLPQDAWKNFDSLGLEEEEEGYEESELLSSTRNELYPGQTSEYPHDDDERAPTRTRSSLVMGVDDDDHDDTQIPNQDFGLVREQDRNGNSNSAELDGGHDDEITRLLDMVKDAKLGRVVLKTRDYNTILARLAIAPELDVEQTLEGIMQTYRQMVEMAKVGMLESGPDATTYELLIHTLNRRLSATKTAVDIIHEMMRSRAVGWTPRTLKAAFQLCQRRNDLHSARLVLKDVVEEKSRSFKIPSGVLLVYLDMLKAEDAQDEALELLKLAMEVSTVQRGGLGIVTFSFGLLTILFYAFSLRNIPIITIEVLTTSLLVAYNGLYEIEKDRQSTTPCSYRRFFGC
jgi:hypothetical protein